ncbi:N-6 DNA methylase [Streptomyces roseiscleroticus]
MMLIVLRHRAESERADPAASGTDALDAWRAFGDRGFRLSNGYEAVGIISQGLLDGGLPDLFVSNLRDLDDVPGSRLIPLFDSVVTAADPAVLFDDCLRLAQTKSKGGDYFTPPGLAQLLIGLMDPEQGDAVYDPVCGAGGFLLRARDHVASHGGSAELLALYGQDASRFALQTAVMNLTVHGAEAHLMGPASSLTDDRFPESTFDVVVANPPFNQTGWDENGYSRGDYRWRYGTPPAGNANFAWAQHVLSKMAPAGRGGILLPTGAASTTKPAERDIRTAIVEADVLSCVIELPAGLLPHVRNPVSLWLFTGSKQPRRSWGHHDQSGRTLVIDAGDTAVLTGRGRRELTDETRARIVDTFAAWRGVPGHEPYEDVPGWCRSLSREEIAAAHYDVLPSRHVGSPAVVTPSVDLHDQVDNLAEELLELFETSGRLEDELRDLLRQL